MKRSMLLVGSLIAAWTAAGAFAMQSQEKPPDTVSPERSRTDREAGRDDDDDRTTTRDEVRTRRGDASPSPRDVQTVVDQVSIPLTDAIRTAEDAVGDGKKVCLVEICSWKDVGTGLRSSARTANRDDKARADRNRADRDGRTEQARDADTDRTDSAARDGLTAESPVIRVVCVGDNRMSEVVVCGRSGKVIGTRDNATLHRTRVSSGRTGSSRLAHDDAWNRRAMRWQKVSDLRGKNVVATEGGNDIGDVRDLVVDPDSPRSLYYVIEFQNQQNLGNKWFAMPISACRLDSGGQNVILSVPLAQIQPSSGFSQNAWPNMSDLAWGAKTHESYGVQPYWETSGSDRHERSEYTQASDDSSANRSKDRHMHDGRNPPKRWQRASDLLGKPVRNPEGQDLGNVRDIVIDADSGRILYGVLTFGGFLGLGDKLFAVPWGAFELAGDAKAFVLNVDKSRLERAEGFDKANWPDMANEQWATNTYRQYDQPMYWSDDGQVRRDR